MDNIYDEYRDRIYYRFDKPEYLYINDLFYMSNFSRLDKLIDILIEKNEINIHHLSIIDLYSEMENRNKKVEDIILKIWKHLKPDCVGFFGWFEFEGDISHGKNNIHIFKLFFENDICRYDLLERLFGQLYRFSGKQISQLYNYLKLNYNTFMIQNNMYKEFFRSINYIDEKQIKEFLGLTPVSIKTFNICQNQKPYIRLLQKYQTRFDREYVKLINNLDDVEVLKFLNKWKRIFEENKYLYGVIKVNNIWDIYTKYIMKKTQLPDEIVDEIYQFINHIQN